MRNAFLSDLRADLHSLFEVLRADLKLTLYKLSMLEAVPHAATTYAQGHIVVTV